MIDDCRLMEVATLSQFLYKMIPILKSSIVNQKSSMLWSPLQNNFQPSKHPQYYIDFTFLSA